MTFASFVNDRYRWQNPLTPNPLSRRAGEGDFFVSVPGGGDAYILSEIIHDWDDDRSVAILEGCHRAMPKHGRLLLVEQVVPPGNGPSLSKFADLNMLVVTGGRERTEAEYRALYAAAGFRLTQVIPTQGSFSVIEGVVA